MSHSRKTGRSARAQASAVAGRGLPRSTAVLLGLVVVAGAGFWWSRARHANAPTGSAAPVAATALQRLTGRWVRIDGGYVLEIRGVDAGGKLDAAYFNPRPIRVAKAEASQDGAAVKLFVELRDLNYPGSTYSLRYDPGRDVLEGAYFQAMQRETYDVSFVRR